jgi:hypothetical protein
MGRQMDVLVDEVVDTLRRTAETLGANRIDLERLTVAPGDPARITAVFAAHTAEATGQGEPPTPFHWQADGAGDVRVG